MIITPYLGQKLLEDLEKLFNLFCYLVSLSLEDFNNLKNFEFNHFKKENYHTMKTSFVLVVRKGLK